MPIAEVQVPKSELDCFHAFSKYIKDGNFDAVLIAMVLVPELPKASATGDFPKLKGGSDHPRSIKERSVDPLRARSGLMRRIGLLNFSWSALVLTPRPVSRFKVSQM